MATPVTPQPADFATALTSGLTTIGNTALTGIFAEQAAKKATSSPVLIAVVAGGGLLLVGGLVLVMMLRR